LPLYFAYGANMDTDAMARRCPKSKPLGVARLARTRFAIMPNGWGNVVADIRRNVHGVLWDLALSDVKALDAYEDVGKGLYAKIIQPVIKAAGGSSRALVYVGKGDGGKPRPEYIGAVITAARAWNLPPAYVAELEVFARGMDASAPPPATQQVNPMVRPRFATPFARR
jgi:hypothetical protein